MPDPQPSPAPGPTPKRNRSDINQEWIQELTDSQQIAAAALKPIYAPALADGEIDGAKVSAFADDIKAAQKLASDAKLQTTSKENVTGDESDLMDALIAAIQEVQKRAKQKYEASNPGVLKDYGIGKKWYNSRAVLEQTATDVLTKLASDTLPGITPEKITALEKAAKDYKDVQTAQTGGQSGATTDRALLEKAVTDIAARRRQIQFAADASWPHTDKANAGIRAEFKLPADRPMK